LAKLQGEIMCPTCHTTLDMSNSLEAKRIEAFISRRIAAGDSENQIKDNLVAQFGTAILAAPPDSGFGILAWWLPITGVLGGATILGVSAWHWSRRNEHPAAAEAPLPALPAELERQIDEELARL
jgi:cytochrome c-type biogenesis protein CcmH